MSSPSAEPLAAVAGAGMVVAGGVWSSAAPDTTSQGAAVALACLGLVIAGAGAVAGTSARWRMLVVARSVALGAIRDAVARPVPPPVPRQLVTVSGGTWVHLSSCLLVGAKPTRVRRTVGRAPLCPVCGGGAHD